MNEDFTWRKGYYAGKFPGWFLHLTKYPNLPALSAVYTTTGIDSQWCLVDDFRPLEDTPKYTAAEARRLDEERLGLEPCLVEET